jgi:hypothetical protein
MMTTMPSASPTLLWDLVKDAASGEAPVLAETPLDLTVITRSAHPSNQLIIERRAHDGSVLSPVRAWPQRVDWATGSQYFRALLPALEPGEAVQYRPVLCRGGQVLDAAATRTLTGTRVPKRADSPRPPLPTDIVPRYEYAMDFFGALTAQWARPPESFGPGPDGLHVKSYIASGEIRGPRINAKVRGEANDWLLIRTDGVGMCDVHITYETTDGALLLSRYYGILDLGPDGYARAGRGEYDPVPPLVVVPQFVTSHPSWLWLNRVQCIGVGRVMMADLSFRFDIYGIRAGEMLPLPGRR